MDMETIAPARLATRVLLIEDNPADARLVEIFLRESTLLDCEITRATELQSGLECLEEGEYDVILLDLTLPDSQGFSTVITMIKEFPEYTIIVMTGLEDETLALNSVKAGAQDFIVKGKFDANLLSRTISYAMERHSLIKRVEDYARKIQENERRLLEAQEMARIGNWELDIITSRMLWSEEVFRILGYAESGMETDLNHFLDRVMPADQERVKSEISRSTERGAPFQIQFGLTLPDGSDKYVTSKGQIKMNQKTGSLVLVGTIQDISSLGQGLAEGTGNGTLKKLKPQLSKILQALRDSNLDNGQLQLLGQLEGLLL
jgi:DNA-binding response OmpR family regulator